jgi:hypothetical protein
LPSPCGAYVQLDNNTHLDNNKFNAKFLANIKGKYIVNISAIRWKLWKWWKFTKKKRLKTNDTER